VDVFTRESLAIEVGQRLKREDVVRVLSRIGLQRAVPKTLFCDNGTEFTSEAMDLWKSQAPKLPETHSWDDEEKGTAQIVLVSYDSVRGARGRSR